MATVTRTAEVEIVKRAQSAPGYVDWGAIFAGAAVAAAISMILVAFGSALGLSLASFSERPAMPGMGLVIAVGLWLLWLQITSAFGGGYVAGRLRRRLDDAPSHEVTMRDGMHGLVVWAVGVLIGSMLAAWIATIGAAGTAAVASSAVSNPQATSGMTDYYVDRLLRPETPQASSDTAEQPATAAPPARTVSPETRSELGRLLMAGGLTSPDSADRDYLVRRLAQETGQNEQAVAERLDATLAVMKARADRLRRLTVMMAFITAVSLLISAVAAWWATNKGGEHRDQAVDHSHFIAWR